MDFFGGDGLVAVFHHNLMESALLIGVVGEGWWWWQWNNDSYFFNFYFSLLKLGKT